MEAEELFVGWEWGVEVVRRASWGIQVLFLFIPFFRGYCHFDLALLVHSFLSLISPFV